MDKYIQTFVIWHNAKYLENEIINKVREKFIILKEYEIFWTPKLFMENMSAFYGDNFIFNKFQGDIRGNGSFILIVAEDKEPRFAMIHGNRGEVTVNKNAFQIKQEMREKLKSFAFHASNDIKEARHNIALLLGKSIEDFLKETTMDGSREVLYRDTPSVSGWKNLKEFFYILNQTCNYVLLRNFNAIPNEHIYDTHGDIDILVDDIKNFLAILNPRIPTYKNAFHFFNWENFGGRNINLLVHPKFVGDNYYDINMQKKLLETRVLNNNGVYVPNDEMYFYSLLHHGVFHKENWQKYNSILVNLSKKLNIKYIADKEYLCDLMTQYMKRHNYKVAKHLDNKAASLMLDNIKDKTILKKPTYYYFYNDFSLTVFNENAIFYNPELVTKFIARYDIFLDLHRHVFSREIGGDIYDFVNFRAEQGELIWQFNRRLNDISIFSYKPGLYEKTFVFSNCVVKTDYVIYNAEVKVAEMCYKNTVEDILLCKYIKLGKDVFLEELDTFICEVFFVYQDDSLNDYLQADAWDMLPKNCFFDKQSKKYIFFDKEAKFIKKLHKSLYLFYLIDDLNGNLSSNFNFTYDEKVDIYKYFIRKYNLIDMWNWAKIQRIREMNSIFNNKNYFYDYVKNSIRILFDKEKILRYKKSMLSSQPNAKERIKNQLSYKLGAIMIENSKDLYGYLKLPFLLLSAFRHHNINSKSKKIKLLPLELLPDYQEALKYKNHMSYKLGQALIKATKNWYKGGGIWLLFEIRKIKKDKAKKKE